MAEKRTINQNWIDALESSEYEQNFGSYYRDGRYCAMGLGLKIIGMPIEDGFNCMFSDAQIRELLGVKHSQFMDVVQMNDHKKMSFKEIAKVLRTW